MHLTTEGNLNPRADKLITCADCGDDFLHSSRDQEFYEQQGYTDPRRCRTCRKLRKQTRFDQ